MSAFEEGCTGFDGVGPWPPGTRVALAFSGGADSVYLAETWVRWSQGRQLEARALIVDHGHREGCAEAATHAADLARGIGLSADILRGSGGGNEADLRDLRYALLTEAMQEAGESVLATAHQADDNAETILLRILRGTGLKGLRGIPRTRQLAPGLEVRRPLLNLRRAAIRSALRAAGSGWWEDPTNADPSAATRNLIRLELLPALRAAATGDPVKALLRLRREVVDEGG